MNNSTVFDYAIIGAGIVGLATGRELLRRFPNAKIAIFDKEADIGCHQTGRNSGVVHAGIYYQPGSLKAKFCRQGLEDTEAYCLQHDLPYQQVGKLIVATDPVELSRLQKLFANCKDNHVDVSWMDSQQISQVEPNIKGLAAIYSPRTAITDYRAIADCISRQLVKQQTEVFRNTRVLGIDESEQQVVINTTRGVFTTKYLIACAGLQADRIAKLCFDDLDFSIVPFRGEFHQLKAEAPTTNKMMIYPVPDPSLPFLGVHITPRVDGTVIIGPNAVQAWHREGYQDSRFSLIDTLQMMGFWGYWKLLAKHWRSGFAEYRDSIHLAGYIKRVQKYCPELTASQVVDFPSGIRAQAVSKEGALIHDFIFKQSPRSLHVCNAPSPAATSAFPIARHIVDKVETKQVF